MASRIAFSMYEAVLLLDAYLSVINGVQLRTQAIKKVSDDLRKMAINNGLMIDETYRSVNGIRLQMESMESAYRGKRIKMPATKLFAEVVMLYRESRNKYDEILREAKSVIDGKKEKEELVADWLAQNVPPPQLSEMYICYSEIESFCTKIKVLRSPLFETVDLETIKKVQKTVAENRMFRFAYRKQMKKMITAMQYYLAFVKNLEKTKDKENKAKAKEKILQSELITETRVAPDKKSGKVNCTEEEILNKMNEWFQREIPMARATQVIATLNQFSEYAMENGITSKKLFQITDSDEVDKLLKISKENRNIRKTFWGRQTLLTCGLYNYSLLLHEIREKNIVPIASNSKEKTEQLIEQQAEKNESSILEDTKETLVQENSLKNASKADLKAENSDECSLTVVDFTTSQRLSYTKPVSYTYFGKEYTDISNWTQLYVAVLASLFEDYPEKLLQMRNTNISGAKRIDFGSKIAAGTMLDSKRVNDDFYVETNLSATDIVSKIRVLLDKCNVDYENLEIKYEKRDSGVTRGDVVDLNQASNADGMYYQISEQGENYATILEKYFNENGYQPGRAIYRGRFKRYYAALFGQDVPEADEVWEKTLQFIGTERDGRIFPKQDRDQNDLLNEIIENVVSTLDAGASGISLEALYDKYSHRLADSLQIYNQDAMTELLIAKADHRFTKRYTCLVNGDNNADPRADIIRVIQEYHEPKTLGQLHEKLWYIPFDRMKYMIVTEPSIVRAEQSCYYYAPNLPVSTDELQQIIRIIQEEIDTVSFVVGTRLVDLIYEKCPEVALNTEMLAPLCVRNSLAYLLRDRFSFKSAVISALDSELNMTDVYAEFARERDHFTLDELKEFSEELNVCIYWEAVMGEVVRLSDREFIRKDHITFDVEAIDAILDEQCHGDYMPMKDVSLYLSFPNIGYQWNAFVLSSYLYHTSKKFRFLFQSFSQSIVTGAMVRADSPITNYHEMIVDVLSHSDALRSPKVALQYIVSCGFQQRLAYNSIENAVQEAKLLREKQIKEEK